MEEGRSRSHGRTSQHAPVTILHGVNGGAAAGRGALNTFRAWLSAEASSAHRTSAVEECSKMYETGAGPFGDHW